MTLANKLTYNEKLKAGNRLIESATFTANCNEVSVDVKIPFCTNFISS